MTQNCSCHGVDAKHSQTVTAVLERPRYSPGLILEDGDLTAAVEYTRALNRLLFRNLFGCGVICGLTVSAKRDCGLAVTISSGLALDGCGDPVQLPKDLTITVDENTVKGWEEPGATAENKFWVVLCGKEKNCAPRPLVCESDEYDGVTQPTRIRALAEVAITRENPTCVCDCPTRGRTPVTDTALPAGGAGPPATGNPHLNQDADPCHGEHERAEECAPDCGCGNACDCGCCVLLAEVKYIGGKEWESKHAGVRRRVRAKLVPDREPDSSQGAATYSPGGAANRVYMDSASGEQLTAGQAMERIGQRLDETARRPATIRLAEFGLAPVNPAAPEEQPKPA